MVLIDSHAGVPEEKTNAITKYKKKHEAQLDKRKRIKKS